jgi:SAM-dependent methyltransferase
MSYQYDSEFFDFVNASAGRSAHIFLREFAGRVLGDMTRPSVLDVGCGRGVWLAEWARLSSAAIQGVDGDYVNSSTLAISPAQFLATDISRAFDLGRKFDLVECLEVAEHVPADSSDVLVANLARHGDLILFSAATPGQGGEFHVNERPHSYWHAKFASLGFQTYDAIRRHVKGIREIEPWYRYNAFVYANGTGRGRLSDEARTSLVPDGTATADVSPLSWRLRCAAIALLPGDAASNLARLKHRLANKVRLTGRT